jgi:hypothetical protein
MKTTSLFGTSRIRRAPRVIDQTNLHKAKRAGFGWTSNNWSGYAISGGRGKFTSISGEWIVPKVRAGRNSAYSSTWVGIDGFENKALIQAGTEQDFVNGSPHYYAWWEILPAAETIIPHPVYPGDRVRAEITRLAGTKWLITLRNKTRKWNFRTVQTYSGPRTSAEWIMEAPQVGGRVTTLANYGQTAFRFCAANGRNPKLVQNNGGVMVQNNIQVSTPSIPGSAGNGFRIAYGAKIPPSASARNVTRNTKTNAAPVLTTKRNTLGAVKKSKPLLLLQAARKVRFGMRIAQESK